MSIKCSVIINTFNRAPYLQRLLAGLAHLKDIEFEVIVGIAKVQSSGQMLVASAATST